MHNVNHIWYRTKGISKDVCVIIERDDQRSPIQKRTFVVPNGSQEFPGGVEAKTAYRDPHKEAQIFDPFPVNAVDVMDGSAE